MEASVVLAIGAAGAYHRAGLPFALPPRWEDDYREWTEDNAVREALGVSSDREAERVLTRMLRDSGLRRAADLVFERRVAEVALGVRPDDSTLARLYRVVYETARSALPSFVRKAFEKFERDYPRYARRAADRLGVSTASPSDVLAEIDADIDAEVARAGFSERMAVALTTGASTVTVAGPVDLTVSPATLAAIGVGSAIGPGPQVEADDEKPERRIPWVGIGIGIVVLMLLARRRA